MDIRHHPRQDEQSLDFVRAMKPSWSLGKPCFSWIKLPPSTLVGDEEPDSDDDYPGEVLIYSAVTANDDVPMTT